MAGQKKILLYISSFFSTVSAACSLVPYISVYKILEVLLKNYVFYFNNNRNTNDKESDSQIMIKWGIISIISFACYTIFQMLNLIFSHISAFSILYNIRIQIAEHIGFLPLGYLSSNTTGVAFLQSFVTFVIPVGLLLLMRNESDVTMALDYIFFIAMSPGLSSPLHNLLMLVSTLDILKEGNNRIDAVLNKDIIPQPEDPKIPTEYSVEFKNVTVNYEKSKKSKRGDHDVLSDVSFKAENGTITALVGPSGSGKSTIGNLIPRFWDVEKGEICIGGINVKDINYSDLMNVISFVFQDTFLFNDTVYNNIAIGRIDAKEEVIAAAKAAQCHEFIEELPKKYDTIIGSAEDQEGVLLSGGEQQRVCIARAILKNSPILVLDEATAYSDSENECNIQLALKELIKNKTFIVIAHNLNTIKSDDKF